MYEDQQSEHDFLAQFRIPRMEVKHQDTIEVPQSNQTYSANYQVDPAKQSAALKRFDSNMTITTLKSKKRSSNHDFKILSLINPPELRGTNSPQVLF